MIALPRIHPVVLITVAVVVLVLGFGVANQVRETYRAPVVEAAARPSTPVEVSDGQPITWGPHAAPVTVDVWADFHCPHCAEFEETYGPILADAVAAGTVQLRTYPLAFVDAGSRAASNAYACAAAAGYAEPYYTALFANSELRWSEHQLTLLFEQLTGSPSTDFRACVADRRYDGWVTSLDGAADQAGVSSTPTLVVDGTSVDVSTLTPTTLTNTLDKEAQQ